MIRDITIGQYFPGDSVLHRADPRIKIIWTLLFMVLIFLVDTFFGYLMLMLFMALVIVVSGVPFKYTLKGLKPVIIIILFAAVINVFTVPGRPIFEYGFLHPTFEGVIEAIKITFRLVLLISGASLLTLTTTPILLTDGLEKLMEPMKKIGVPTH